uniref:ATP synthase subunit 8 n=1 Tax=Stenchaetothrips minutus TaxID=3118776 RepID=UPI0030E24916
MYTSDLPMCIPMILIILIFGILSLILLNETKWSNKKSILKSMKNKSSKMFFLSLFIS